MSFVEWFADEVAALPGVVAVALGGSRARDEHGPDSDWDFALYYRGSFDPDSVRAKGWTGEVSDVGGWGGGVMNGGAWLTIEDRRVDLHYRDLDEVEHHWSEATAGRFGIEPLLFYVAGIPTYAVVAELAINRVLRGELPRPDYPEALRRTANDVWHDRATAHLGYASGASDALTATANATRALIEESHGRLAAQGIWVTNEKRIASRAGLGAAVDRLAAGEPAIDVVRDLI